MQSQFYVYNKQAKSIHATGPLFKWLIVMKDAVAMQSLITSTVSPSDRVSFISTVTSSDASPVLLTKIDLIQPSMIGTWNPWEKVWNLYTLDVFSPFRGLFGKEFIVASLPVGQFNNIKESRTDQELIVKQTNHLTILKYLSNRKFLKISLI